MLKYYNKETRNAKGDFYRHEDWSVQNLENPGDSFTDIKPPYICFDGVPCDWNENSKMWDVDINSLKKKKLIEIKNNLESAVSGLKDNYGQTEIDSWETQISEAKIYIENKTNPTPNIDIMVNEGIESKDNFVNSVLENESVFKVIVFKAIGQRVAKSDLVKEIAENENLNNSEKVEQILNCDTSINL